MNHQSPIPYASTAAEERAAIVAWHDEQMAATEREIATVPNGPQLDLTKAGFTGLAAAHRASREFISTGQHLRGKVEPRPPCKDFRETQQRLIADWHVLWERNPEEVRRQFGPILAVSLASKVAAKHVESLDAKGFERLHEGLGFPAEWSRSDAIGALTGFLYQVYGQEQMEAHR